MLRAWRAVLAAAIAQACAAFAPGAGSLALRSSGRAASARGALAGRITAADAAGARRRPASVAMMSQKIQELNKGAWEARLAALEKQAILDFQTAIREFYSEVGRGDRRVPHARVHACSHTHACTRAWARGSASLTEDACRTRRSC
jgi:hypothetical protein